MRNIYLLKGNWYNKSKSLFVCVPCNNVGIFQKIFRKFGRDTDASQTWSVGDEILHNTALTSPCDQYKDSW